jgi:hypothetical protein
MRHSLSKIDSRWTTENRSSLASPEQLREARITLLGATQTEIEPDRSGGRLTGLTDESSGNLETR